MGVEIKLTDHELPVSPSFIRFVAQHLRKQTFGPEVWSDQLSEALSVREEAESRRAIEAAELVMGDERGRELLAHAYGLLYALISGALAPLDHLLSRFRFIPVVGVPRSGGSYLTAELYRALGMVPEQVPNALAHDSFPEAAPFQLQPGINGWVLSLKTLAEYLTMVEIFFADRKPHQGKIVVPKKLTQCVYAGGFFRRVLGTDAEYVVTVRHPAATCVSTYDKSGGLPADGRFVVRSNIEAWCRRDLEYAGCGTGELMEMNYFEAYLRYWEQYHVTLAMSGLAATRRLRVVAFDKATLQTVAQSYHERYGSGLQAGEFRVSDRARRLHPEWIEHAQPAIDRVIASWRRVGIEFPAAEITGCW